MLRELALATNFRVNLKLTMTYFHVVNDGKLKAMLTSPTSYAITTLPLKIIAPKLSSSILKAYAICQIRERE